MSGGRVSDSRQFDILGAGLCGSLLAILLARLGFTVTVREARQDPRLETHTAGRSINLALSSRGIRGLERAGVMDEVGELLLPMRGRLVHESDGSSSLLPYGQREHELIYSVSRAALNRLLIDVAERRDKVEFLFGHEVTGYDRNAAAVEINDGGKRYTLPACSIIAADGAGSHIRRAFDGSSPIAPVESLLPHGYKELTIPPAEGGGFRLENDALHIWPRDDFMLIALPNPGGDFTLTLFLPNDGPNGFSALTDDDRVLAFFNEHFADAVPLIPDLAEAFAANPVGILGTVRCKHWHDADRFLLIGDAAHAIVPFHGQGMNLAFEDCVVFERMLAENPSGDHAALFRRFEAARLEDANAIADMALENYVEMRATVRDPAFALQKQLAFELERRLPERFVPRYSMVMFHDEIPYAVAERRGRAQAALLSEMTNGISSLEDIDIERAERLVRERLPELKDERRV